MNRCWWVLGCASALWLAGIMTATAQEPGEGGIVGTGHTADGTESRFERPDFPDRVERFEPVVPDLPELPSAPSTASDLFGAGGGGSPPTVTATPPK